MRSIVILAAMAAFLVSAVAAAYPVASDWEDPADYPLMGDWEGRWINPTKGYEEDNPAIAAQVFPVKDGKYRVRFLSRLYLRADPYLDVVLPLQDGKLVLDQDGWKATFNPEGFKGTGTLHGDPVDFELEPVEKLSPTLGAAPPEGAVVLFDGSNFDAWQHPDGRDVTWELLDNGAMQIISHHWDGWEEKGLGGDIVSKESFGDLQLHVEFRYPVEADMEGQRRGNSGVFVGDTEVQVLNSYGLEGYWDQCGSLYKIMPAHVNAAAPPFQWQTYDITVDLPEEGEERQALMTVQQNGRMIQNEIPVDLAPGKHAIKLQDHINRIQYRNVWVKEL